MSIDELLWSQGRVWGFLMCEHALLLLKVIIQAIVDDVPQDVAGVTQYVAHAWETPAALVEGAKRGSLCCRLALDAAGWPDAESGQR